MTNPPPLPASARRRSGCVGDALKGLLILSVLGGLAAIYWGGANPLTWLRPSGVHPKPTDADRKQAVQLSEDLAQRIDRNSELPSTGSNSWGRAAWAGNQEAVDRLLEQLAGELGSSRTLGVLRTLRQQRAELQEVRSLENSSDPQVAGRAKADAAKLKVEIDQLTKELTRAYNNDGFPFTEEQVISMSLSPQGEETASLVSAFHNIKAICGELEERLRRSPTHESARQYYASYHVLLLALDRLQKHTIDKIEQVHLARMDEIRRDAESARTNAKDILTEAAKNNELMNPNLQENQKLALAANMKSLTRTIDLAGETKEKMRRSLESLKKSNHRLKFAIETANNSLTAMRLRVELMAVEQTFLSELQTLEDITVPAIVAVDFTDGDVPWLSPRSAQPK